MPAHPDHTTGPALISQTLSLPPGQSFCWNRQVILPKEAVEHGATLATSSFSLYFLAPGLGHPMQVPQGTHRQLKHVERDPQRPGGRLPYCSAPWQPSEDAGQTSRVMCYVGRGGPGQPAGGGRLMAPPALLLGHLTHHNKGSHMLSLSSHPLSSRCSHLTHLPSAKELVFIPKPALCPYSTCCF